MTTAQKLSQRLKSADALNSKLVAEIGQGNGAVGLTAIFAMNASKDLAKVLRQVKNAQINGSITNEEYVSIMGF